MSDPTGPELPEGSPNAAKARRAARDPRRPGEECRAAPGTWRPIVDLRRCEGKSDCVEVCPYSVFELGTLTDAEYRSLGHLGRAKARHHGLRTSRTPRATECRACGLCVVSCPEDAVRLVRRDSP
ncbi:MAG TPA: ferredoxin family protein [Thermoplasmata archaeon]|nr:ferredoxin family protein [Thermoplasmata archaeon]